MKYLIWVKIHDPRSVDYTNGEWEISEGPASGKTAERIAQDIRRSHGSTTKVRVLPEGERP